jgi:hypothetical protein
LIVHSAERASLSIVREIALSHRGIQSVLLEFFPAKRPCEKASFIVGTFYFDDIDPREPRFREFHCPTQRSTDVLTLTGRLG